MANEIKSAIDSAFRDYVTDGVPSSGINKPSKSAIRTAGQTIQTQVDTKATIASVDALTDRVDEIEATATAGVKWTTFLIEGRSTGNVNLANGLENGDPLNGLTVQTGKHYFLGLQADPAQNGIYTAVASGAASRATFANSAAELSYIGFVLQGGAVGTGERWTLPLAAADITVDTTALNFAPQGVEPGYAAEVAAARGGEASLSDAMALKADDDAVVHKTGDETINGVKTYSDSPVFPTPSANDNSTKASTTEYVDRGLFEQTVTHVPGYDTDEDGPFTVVSESGRVLQQPLMREEYDTDEDALIVVVGMDGHILAEEVPPPYAPVVNPEAVRQARVKLRSILRGSVKQCRIAWIGDSYFNSWTPAWFRNRMVSIFGNAGPGFVSLETSENFISADTGISIASTGTWTNTKGGKAVPRLSTASTSDPAALRTIFGNGAITSAYLHYLAAVGATAFYRWGLYDGSGSLTDRTNYVFGSDHSLDLSSGYRISMPTDLPASGYWALEIGRSAGTIEVASVDLKNSAAGVIVDNLGVGGFTTNSWLAPNSAAWSTVVGSMNIDLAIIGLGPNDQAGTVSNAGIANNFAEIRQRLLVATPSMDVVFMSPPENFLGRPRKMPDITKAVRAMALQLGVTHVDLQPFFGPVEHKEDYRSTGIRPLVAAYPDDIHPSVDGGDLILCQSIEDLLI